MNDLRSDAERTPHVDGYTVVAPIDSGGFSTVYRAVQHGLERDVAIKVLNSTFDDERQLRTFERECRVMGRLSTHPNIVTVFASALTGDGRPCIIMELYDGTLTGGEQLDVFRAVEIGAKVADALQVVHDNGIVHRDIKPHNIFISVHGEPAIGDFGISSITAERTVTGGTGFSISYAPPEVFEDGETGPAADVYSLGATVYQLLSGEVPFPHHGDPADRIRSTVHKIISAPPPSLARQDAPPELDRLLRQCMAKRPGDRPTSAAEVADRLRRMAASIPRPMSGPPGTTTSRTSPRSTATITTGDTTPPSSPDGGRRPDRADRADADVTALRPRERQTAAPDPVPADDPDVEPTRSRLIIGGAATLAVLVGLIVVTIAVLGGEDDDRAVTTAAGTTTTIAPPSIRILTPPTGLGASILDDGGIEIRWEPVDDADVVYEVALVGDEDTRYTAEAVLVWESVGPGVAPCFTVRTLDADRRSGSRRTAGPVCAAA